MLGGSGNGEQMAANKVDGIRAALAWNHDTAALAREHNNAQVVGCGRPPAQQGRSTGNHQGLPKYPWTNEERHARRIIGQLAEYEQTGDIAGKQIDAALSF